MKLIQLNTWGGKLGKPIIDLFNREDPDFACLQEVYETTPRPGSVFTPPSVYTPKDTYPYYLSAPVYSHRYMHELSEFGNGISSKHEFTETNVVYTKGQHLVDADSLVHDYNVRNFAHASFNINGKVLHIITHHGHHEPDTKDGTPETTRQMNVLADYIKGLDGSIICTGDFNLHPKSTSLKKLNSMLHNLPLEYEIATTRTQFAKRQEVIDFIFVSKDITVNEFKVLDDLVSDHAALLLDFDL